MKRQWNRMKPQKKPSSTGYFDFGLCFHCQQRKSVGFWVFCHECLQLPEVKVKMNHLYKVWENRGTSR